MRMLAPYIFGLLFAAAVGMYVAQAVSDSWTASAARILGTLPR